MQIINEEHLNDSVIENLFMVYYSKIDNKVYTSTEYKDKQKKLTESEESIRNCLSKEDEVKFEKFIKDIYDINFTVNKGYFTEGFIQGVKLMQEINSKDNDK